LKSLEAARNGKLIGAPLEARVNLSAGGDLLTLLAEYAAELPGLFIVSQVAVTPAESFGVTVERASGQKCERCWKYTEDVGADARYPTVCASCAGSIDETGNGQLNE
jgi:isoleucyl-tRNA synthetase